MATMGYGVTNDVNNTIPVSSAYPGGRSYGLTQPSATRSRYRNNSSGEVASVNQSGTRTAPVNVASNAPAPDTGPLGKPNAWWLIFAVVFVAFVYGARRLAPEASSEYGIKLNLYNGIFLTLWIVLILNLLKVLAARFKVPGLSEMILAA